MISRGYLRSQKEYANTHWFISRGTKYRTLQTGYEVLSTHAKSMNRAYFFHDTPRLDSRDNGGLVKYPELDVNVSCQNSS